LVKALEPAVVRGLRTVVLARDEAMATRVVEQLWTVDESSFIPHAEPGDQPSGLTPVIILVGSQIPAKADLAVNLTGEVPTWVAGWSGTLCDLIWTVSKRQEDEGRQKWEGYKAREDVVLEVKRDLEFTF
jgi:DNA polymerase IIIc chi subunit